MKKRIVLLLSVVALMVVMLATSVAPAFAKKSWDCLDPTRVDEVVHRATTTAERDFWEGQGYVCTKVGKVHRG